MGSLRLLPTLFAALVTLPSAHAAEPLRVAASSAWTMPYAQVEHDRLTNGIVAEIYAAIAVQAGFTLQYVVLPRKRLELEGSTGAFDLHCYTNPKWRNTPDDYIWSKPLFVVEDIIVGSAGTPDPKTIEGLINGARISTVLGYNYPGLEAAFGERKIMREDSTEEQKVLRKLTAGRTPYGVATSLGVDWYRAAAPQHNLAPWRLTLEQFDVHCAIPKQGKIPAQRLLDAIEQLRKNRRFEEIQKKYR